MVLGIKIQKMKFNNDPFNNVIQKGNCAVTGWVKI